MNTCVRVLVVDDYSPWRRFVSALLQEQPGFSIVGDAADGLEAVQKAQDLRPDLILLDISLPTLNGIEAARRIHALTPNSKILFVSANRSSEIVGEALLTGARGYVLKAEATRELLPAINAVLKGKRFVSVGLTEQNPAHPTDQRAEDYLHFEPPQEANGDVVHHHEFRVYPEDAAFVETFARFVEAAIKLGNAVVVLATTSHHASILQRLRLKSVDVDSAIERKRYVFLDVVESFPTLRLANAVHGFAPEEMRAATEGNRVGVG